MYMRVSWLVLCTFLLVSLLTMPISYAAEGVHFKSSYYPITIGESTPLNLLTDSNKTIAIKSIKIASGKEFIAIDSKFNVKGLSLGYAMVEATATNGSKTTASIIVYGGLVTNAYKVALSPTETYTMTLQSKQLKPLQSKVTYTSSDASIATVDETGLITAISIGTAYIYATDTQETQTLTVVVYAADDPEKATATSIDALTLQLYTTFVQDKGVLEPNPNRALYPTLTDGNAAVQNTQVQIKSSNPSVLTVITKGYEYNTIYAKKPGTAVLTVTANGFSKDFPLTVTAEPKVKSLKILKRDSNFATVDWTRVKIGLPMNLALVVTYVDGTTREFMGEFDGVTWSSSNPAIAKIDHHSLLGIKAGTVTITATYKGQTIKFNMQIVNPH